MTPPRALSGAGWWSTFGLGLLVGLLGVAALRPPPRLHAMWCRLRHGAWPGSAGLVLRAAPAPPAVAGAQGGPWLLVELVNTGRDPLEAWLATPPGEELELLLDGQLVPPDPARVSRAAPLARVSLRPGQRVGQLLDLGARVPGLTPGPHRVAVRRRRLPGLDDLQASSGEVEVVAR